MSAGGLRAQFGHPRGLAGWAVGHLLAVKNRRRGRWVVSLLGLRPGARVLEIGFGPGVDVARAARAVGDGLVAGVDPSREMVRHALRRNAPLVRAGRVDLRLASARALPFAEGSFDRVFASNSVQFWGDLAAGLREARRVLVPGGLVAVAIQPRNPGATGETTRAWERRLLGALREVGFAELRAETAALRPVPAVCVLGVR